MDSLDDKSKKIKELFSEMDKDSLSFKTKSGLGCRKECSQCCKNPNVSAAPIEMLPMALSIVAEGQAEIYLRELVDKENICGILTKVEGGRQFCSRYEDRPVVCRLFGWCKVTGKTGSELSICKVIREDSPALADSLSDNREIISEAPDIAYWAQRVRDQDPSLSQTMRINEALLVMLKKVLFIKDLSGN